MRQQQWKLKEVDPDKKNMLVHTLGIHPVTAQVLCARGVENERDVAMYLGGKLSDLLDPFLMQDMKQAVERIFVAFEKKEKVLIHGDYDVDGLTSAALLADFFRNIQMEAYYYIPDRFTDGYGISERSIDKALELGSTIMITVDCGVNAHEAIAQARQRGVDVIVVDHHEIKTHIPQCAAVLNPKRNDCQYPFKDLAAVGVAFKLIHAFLKEARKRNLAWERFVDLKDYLEIAAIGTVADMVPLRGENKILVKYGLERLAGTQREGLKALLELCQLTNRKVNAGDIAYRIAPRMNATGRMGDALDSIDLMLTKDAAKARLLAQSLDDKNRERQTAEREIVEEATRMIKEKSSLQDDWILVIEKENWSIGIVGIVAARMMRRFHRPAFVLSKGEKVSKGSARSYPFFPLHEMLKSCEDLFESYGGHACAAGLTIANELVPEFRERINKIAKSRMTLEDLNPVINIDCELYSDDINNRLFEELKMLEPHGQENPVPVFLLRKLRLMREPYYVGQDHVKMQFQVNNKSFNAIAFGWKKMFEEESQHEKKFSKLSWDTVFEFNENQYGGIVQQQLQVRDLSYECF
ncbi:MAG: single-stranded-DNA-specific exonuclease RecJ [Chlamydiota bacterium]|nr:single-stranded-DNA-specific exonuclease RecJ [Chlamydiota bacterium]